MDAFKERDWATPLHRYWLYLFLTSVGLGDPSGLGYTRRSVPVMPGLTLFWDFRFFVLLFALIMVLDMGVTLLRFSYSRREYLEVEKKQDKLDNRIQSSNTSSH